MASTVAKLPEFQRLMGDEPNLRMLVKGLVLSYRKSRTQSGVSIDRVIQGSSALQTQTQNHNSVSSTHGVNVAACEGARVEGQQRSQSNVAGSDEAMELDIVQPDVLNDLYLMYLVCTPPHWGDLFKAGYHIGGMDRLGQRYGWLKMRDGHNAWPVSEKLLRDADERLCGGGATTTTTRKYLMVSLQYYNNVA